MKYINKLSKEALEREQERWTRYLKMHLADKDRCKIEDYIRFDYKMLNAIKLALKNAK